MYMYRENINRGRIMDRSQLRDFVYREPTPNLIKYRYSVYLVFDYIISIDHINVHPT